MTPKLEKLRELHLLKITRSLTDEEEHMYKSLKKGWKARRLCKDLTMVYKDPRMQELLRVKPTEQRWYDLIDELLKS